MSIYRQKVILWPLELTALNNDVVFEDQFAAQTTVALPIGAYLTSGEGSAVSPADLLQEFNTAMATAAGILGIAGVFKFTRDAEGFACLTGASPGLYIKWDLGTFDKAILGYDTASTTIAGILPQTGDNMMDYQWMPGKPEVHSDPDIPRILASEDLNVSGRPSRVVQSPGFFFRREIQWERLWAARMIQARADDAAFAVPADMPTGDDATWTTLWTYLLGGVGFFNDNRVYVLQDNISPTASDRTGPYEVILKESEPDLFGVEPSSYVQSLSAEQYDASLMLWKETI